MIKFARYNRDADGDAFAEYPAQLRPVQPGDLVLGPAATYVAAASAWPGFTGFVDQFGAAWPE